MQNQLDGLMDELDQVIDDVLSDLITSPDRPDNSAKLALQTDVMQKRMGVIGQRDVPLDRQSYYDAIDAVQTLNNDEHDG